MPMTQANGIDPHYELDGDGEDTIVLINGLADHLETWALQMEDFLGAGYRVLRIDNRGVGKSEAPPGPYTGAGTGAPGSGTRGRAGTRVRWWPTTGRRWSARSASPASI